MSFLFLLKYVYLNVPFIFKQIMLTHSHLLLEYRRVVGEGGKFLRPDTHGYRHMFLAEVGSIVLSLFFTVLFLRAETIFKYMTYNMCFSKYGHLINIKYHVSFLPPINLCSAFH